MNTQDKWNYIVKSYKQNYTKLENDVQKSWEDIFSEFFDYKKLYGEIVTKTYIQLGSRTALIPDIILKKDGKNVVDVELKQYNLALDPHFEQQLVSYLKQLNLSLGIIICNRIYLYSFTYPDIIDKIEIPFEEVNERGVAFVEMFNKNNFDADKIREFVSTERDKDKRLIDIKKVEKEIIAKLIPDHVKEYVREYLLLTDYPEDIVEKVLEDYVFKVEKVAHGTYVGCEPGESHGKDPIVKPVLPVDFPETGDFLIIKTSDARVADCGGSLYDATRHAWHVKYNSVIRYKYVLSVIKGYVKEVYRVDEWHRAEHWNNDFKDGTNRYEFIGTIAPESIRQKWIGKQIPPHYRKPGMASPVVFSIKVGGMEYV